MGAGARRHLVSLPGCRNSPSGFALSATTTFPSDSSARYAELRCSTPIRLPTPLFDLANLPDADVVVLAQQGREAAFRELMRRYERPVFSLVYRMVRDRETAEELAQDTFVKALNHIERYSPEFKLSSWLFKIANNLAIDHLRKGRLPTVSISGAPDAATAAESGRNLVRGRVALAVGARITGGA